MPEGPRWIAPTPVRLEPTALSAPDERTALDQWLEYHRKTLLSKCAGLGAEDLKRRSVPPSRLSLLGIVRHMTEVERSWFRMVAAGEELSFLHDPDDVGADFEDLDDADAAADLEAFTEECSAATAAIRPMQTDAKAARSHRGAEYDLRWILVHMIEEYARHNGHADLLRESIDGVTGD